MKATISKLYDNFGWLVTANGNKDISSITVGDVKELLASGGTVLFRGFDVNQDGFVEFTKKFSLNAVKHSAPSIRPPVTSDGTVTEVLVGNHEVEFHGEMYYLPRRPELLWLYCITPSTKGGATTVCSGEEFLAALSPRTRTYFMNHKVRYLNRYPRSSWLPFAPSGDPNEAVSTLKQMPGVERVIYEKEADLIAFDYVTTGISKSKFGKDVFVNSVLNIKQYEFVGLCFVVLDDGSPVPQEIFAEIKEVGDRVAKPVNWQPGDVLVIENSSVMHGRQAFEGPRKILSRFTMAA